ncbi:precorrin-3B synthase [Pseudomonas profundi]|uniref:precorrin-3B synthase n=1 Tax=Pseudomonas profundi TaxID=1981513 RepID=UPI00123AFFD6|nr:precorrin-3B synthase [Pseudomonas profundi]
MPHHPLNARSTVRPSACPGLLRIVQALDGGICRVKLAGGLLTSAQAQAIALAAQRYASDVLELTNRSNLQIRGVRPECEEQLIQAVIDVGLGPEQEASDDVRNLMLSPAAGLDPHAVLDTRPLAAELLALLQGTPAFHALSPKFAIQLDGGEALAMLSHPHDIWLSALPGAPPRLAFGLAGCPTDAPLGTILPSQAVPFMTHLLSLFLEMADERHSRMRQLLEATPATQLLQQLEKRLPFSIEPPARTPTAGKSDASRTLLRPPGIFKQRQPDLAMVTAGVSLGRMDSQQMVQLARIAEQYAGSRLLLTPWQGVLLPEVPAPRAAAAFDALAAMGLLTDTSEPLTSLIACTGATGCAKGLADTKGDALALAVKLKASGARPVVHLSGCARSCAAAHTTPFTLLASDNGRYQLHQQTPGVTGFGQLRATNLDMDTAADWFANHCPAGNTDA